jgi:hypothetical protein
VICAPPVFWLQRKGLPRWAAILLVVLLLWAGFIGIATLLGTSCVPQKGTEGSNPSLSAFKNCSYIYCVILK